MATIILDLAFTGGSLLAPTIAWTTASSDTTPTFRVTLAADALANDILVFEYDTSSLFTAPVSASHTLSSGDISTGYYDFTTVALSEGAYYARAKNTRNQPRVSPYSTAVLFTIVINVNAPTVSNQAFNYGRCTRTGSGGYQIVATGVPITGAGGTNSLAGTNNSHWAISATGMVTPTATGTGTNSAALNALAASYSLTATVYGDSGSSASCTLTMTGIDNAYHIRTDAELYGTGGNTGVTGRAGFVEGHAQIAANRSTNYTCYVREGCMLATTTTDVNIFGRVWNGSITHTNDGATKATYNWSGVATMTGGSFHLTCETALGASTGGIRLLGCKPIKISNLNLLKVCANANTGSTTQQLNVSTNGTYTTKPSVWITGNNFDAYSSGLAKNYWPCGIQAVGDVVVVEDNLFHGLHISCQVFSVRYGIITRNHMRKSVNDFIRSMGNDIGSVTGGVVHVHIMANNMCDGYSFSESQVHPDGGQTGTNADSCNQVNLIARNYIDLSYPDILYGTQGLYHDDTSGPWAAGTAYVANATYSTNGTSPIVLYKCTVSHTSSAAGAGGDEPGVGASWTTKWVVYKTGLLTPKVTIDVDIWENFTSTCAVYAIACYRGNYTLEKNTCVANTNNTSIGSGSPLGRILASLDATITSADKNIYDDTANIKTLYTGSVTSETNSYHTTHSLASGNALSYYDTYTGPFTPAASGPTWSFDVSSYSAFRADVVAKFTPKVTSAANGKGFTA